MCFSRAAVVRFFRFCPSRGVWVKQNQCVCSMALDQRPSVAFLLQRCSLLLCCCCLSFLSKTQPSRVLPRFNVQVYNPNLGCAQTQNALKWELKSLKISVPEVGKKNGELKTLLFAASYYCSWKGFIVFWLLREKQRQDSNGLWVVLHPQSPAFIIMQRKWLLAQGQIPL